MKMISLEVLLKKATVNAIKELYKQDINDDLIQVQKTRKEFKGDMTIVVFPLLRISRKKPELTGKELGDYLIERFNEIDEYNVIKGFLNLKISAGYWIEWFNNVLSNPRFGRSEERSEDNIVVEYSSPNTNKPLHLGHIRNNLLGFAIANILDATGNKVIKTNIVNDRGIHICKSMLAWKKWGKGETPASSGRKGDHLVGHYYVMFDKAYKEQIEQMVAEGMDRDKAGKNAPLLLEAQEMLRQWEAGEKETVNLWKMMNEWVYEGFDETYKKLGVDFDKIYYESETYKLGKKHVLEGVQKGIFEKQPDSSVWADLSSNGLDRKILLRSDGTSVYMTQDIGTAIERHKDFKFKSHIYVVGNEQDYHFKVLPIILQKLGYEWADHLFHLSYGMVELPEGKMKSREGTVVDADDLIEEMIDTARDMSKELGKLEGYTNEEKENIFRIIGLGALKYFILKVDPRKNMTFNPKESIDFNGNTGPFIQYTYARVRSVLRKAREEANITLVDSIPAETAINEKETVLLKLLASYPQVIREAANELTPAIIANYTYELVKEYNQFYHDYPIIKEENTDLRDFRLVLSKKIAEVVNSAMGLLGIEVPERM